MVSSLLSDALTDPTAVLVDIFQNSSDLDQFPSNVATHFQHVFSTEDALEEIPSLHVHNPPHLHEDRSLVRFNAMIQDTSLSQEIYLAKYAGSCGGWGLAQTEASRENIDYTNLRECSILWAVSIPGENPWCASITDDFAPKPLSNTAYQPSQPHKYPIPGASHIGVQVKIYNLREAESLRSTDLVTFVGILTSELLHADIDSPSPTMVPSLHVLFLQHLPPTIIPCSFPYIPPNPISINGVRDELIAWIADEALAGDRMTAEWILLCIIARVRSRSPPMLPPSLTISRFPPPTPDSSAVPSLCHVLSHILPMLSMLPLSLAILNTTAFAPESKDENLFSGWLQLPKGSVCVITEDMVTEGVVSEQGIINLRIMQDMMNTQTLEYIFPYSRFIFDTDIGVFILSEGRKSALFQTNINVALQDAATADIQKRLYKSADAIALPAKEKLDMFRKFVCSGKVGSVSITDETAKYIQEDFVKERRTAPSREPEGGFTSNDLIQRIMVARLLALSLQESEIKVDLWERAKGLEAARKARI